MIDRSKCPFCGDKLISFYPDNCFKCKCKNKFYTGLNRLTFILLQDEDKYYAERVNVTIDFSGKKTILSLGGIYAKSSTVVDEVFDIWNRDDLERLIAFAKRWQKMLAFG